MERSASTSAFILDPGRGLFGTSVVVKSLFKWDSTVGRSCVVWRACTSDGLVNYTLMAVDRCLDCQIDGYRIGECICYFLRDTYPHCGIQMDFASRLGVAGESSNFCFNVSERGTSSDGENQTIDSNLRTVKFLDS